ncbi:MULTISPECIES: GAF and ANTAR domain-containing protein [unclassified Pseudonocardia]|uniref:GAF and ANTAR domain-containing protein n=1 Tax=unclassified Pseudonocardia TaxID=2619320 RepID=UPI000ADA4E2B|nr:MULTISPECIES: GAF and ANTAR domain-containing protein [unclassified Pseudonocardia]MBN9099828.1 GAF and ANTAR domain-containing protein [Pseudonocardia sp.]
MPFGDHAPVGHAPGPATRAMLSIPRDVIDDRVLARRICEACAGGLGFDGAAISLLTGSPSRHTLWATDATAQRLEDLQFGLNEGACMEAAATGRPVLVGDLRTSPRTSRWPMFAAAVVEQTDVGALFALPLQWGAVNLGVLDLYRRATGELTAAQHRDAIGATDTASLMMLGLRTDPGGGDQLDPTVSSHAEIHQATGMVMVQLGVTATDALARLRAYAFVQQRLLVDVGRDVVVHRLLFTEEMT